MMQEIAVTEDPVNDRAQERLDAVQEEIANLESQFQDEVAAFESFLDPCAEELDEMRITPRSADEVLEHLGIFWLRHPKESTGRLSLDRWK